MIIVKLGVRGQRNSKLADIHERGKGVPVRDPMLQSINSVLSDKKFQERLMLTMTRGKSGGDFLGQRLVQKSKSIIMSKQLKPNADSTVSQKGFDWPLINSGEYYDSIDYETN